MQLRNNQTIEKVDFAADSSVDVHSIFYTIQGEGPLTGHPAIFIRLAGCNLRCPLCDTDYTSKRERLSPEAIVARVSALHPGPRLVVITGGEPFRQAIGLLTQLLEDSGYQIQIETNGTLPPPSGMAASTWIVVSPKTGKVHPDTAERAVAWKYVLDHRSVSAVDGLPLQALEHPCVIGGVTRPPEDLLLGAIYVQPADTHDIGTTGRNLAAVKATCLKYGYTLQVQLHKIIDME